MGVLSRARETGVTRRFQESKIENAFARAAHRKDWLRCCWVFSMSFSEKKKLLTVLAHAHSQGVKTPARANSPHMIPEELEEMLVWALTSRHKLVKAIACSGVPRQ